MRGRGTFVVLEGLDGAGTTTQLQRMAEALRADGHAVTTTCEPSAGPVGALIRQALKGRAVLPGGAPMSHESLALLFAADRLDHLAAEIRPALERGVHVLCDRYVLSSLAYQGATVDMGWVSSLNNRALAADLTLFLEVDVSTASRRRRTRGGPSELYEVDAHQRKIAAQYRRAIALRQKSERIEVIDGTQAPEAVTRRALALWRAQLKRRTERVA
jgi:dTMP kinase